MYQYHIIQWIFFFYFYCFFGWCFESTYVSVKSKKLVNRGFMRGPFLPLYGSGGMMMLIVSAPFQQNLLLTYVAGCVGATVLEYVTGVTMEALFKVRYWDYSYKKFNFQGHICLSSTLAWGGLTILMTAVVHKYVEQVVLAIPLQILTGITLLLTVILSIDFALSFKAAMDLRDILIGMEKMKEELLRLQRRADVYIAVTNEEWNNRVNKYLEEGNRALISLGELKASIEHHLEELAKELTEKQTQHVEAAKVEMDELMQKYRAGLAKLDILSEVKGFYKKNMIRSNPTMTSKLFKDSFEEVRKILFEDVDKDSDDAS